jgi:RNA polymerase sigma factor (sigma-70 family)
MPEVLPSYLAELLHASDSATSEMAWERFVTRVTPLILSVARTLGTRYDVGMDRYTFILDHLRRDDFRKLRTYTADDKCSFTTWLVVVCRRLCVDHHRQQFGRVRNGSDVVELRLRRSLAQSLFASKELEALQTPDEQSPERLAETSELHALLDSCLSRLAPRDRLLLKLKFEDDLNAGEIRRVLRYPTVFHVYRRVNRLLKDLRIALTLAAPTAPRKSEAVRPLNTL